MAYISHRDEVSSMASSEKGSEWVNSESDMYPIDIGHGNESDDSSEDEDLFASNSQPNNKGNKKGKRNHKQLIWTQATLHSQLVRNTDQYIYKCRYNTNTVYFDLITATSPS